MDRIKCVTPEMGKTPDGHCWGEDITCRDYDHPCCYCGLRPESYLEQPATHTILFVC